MHTNIPAPFPDECLRGYGFRVFTSNANYLMTANQLLPELLKACDLSIPQLLTNHSHLAYTRFAYSAYGYLDLKNHPDIISNKNITTGSTPIRRARYCPICINEDLDLYGISYWHRVHHFHGVDHCVKHNVSLVYANPQHNYKYQPSTSSPIESSIPSHRVNVYFGSEYIKKFSTLSIATLDIGLSFEYFVIRDFIIKRFDKLKGGPYINFLELAYKKFPPFWLNNYFLHISYEGVPYDIEKIYLAAKNHSAAKPVKYYLLMMALLWDDPFEAIHECLSTYRSRPLEDGRIYSMSNKYSTL